MASSPSKPELNEFRAEASAWFSENIPLQPDFMMPLTFMEVGTDEQFEFLVDWQRKVYEAGYLGAAWPEEYGGRGLHQAFQDVATDVMRRQSSPIMLNTIGLNWAGPLILDMGSEEERRRYIPGILSAEDIWCQGFSEPENGSDLGNAQTKAVREGDEWVINGTKTWTTHGSYAKYMILLARSIPDTARKYAGLSFFLAPMRIPGVETQPIQKLTGEYGFTETYFTDARIPADSLMGEEGQGWAVAMRTLEYERSARGGQAGGLSIVAPDHGEVVELARRAQRGGRAAIEDPILRDKLVEFMIEAQGIALTNRRASIGPLVQDRPMSIPLSGKLMATEFTRRINEFAITLLGQAGAYAVGEPEAVDGGISQRAYLNAFSATIGGGTSQIQANIVAEHVLGLPKH
ncbi:MAG: acyl-CoA dehydrogenase family protein [Myxococcota bacterium]|nr:acyl-CoA dehydrogenase family protein [Myxococcota bacterium]